MKKYKYHFSFSYWSEQIPKQISTLQLWIQSFTVTGIISSSMSHYETISYVIAGIGFALNLLGHFIYVEEVTDAGQDQE